MIRRVRRRTIQGLGALVVLLLAGLVAAQIAVALPRDSASPAPTPSRTVDWAHLPEGADASWPVCTPPHGTTRTLPLAAEPAFVVVGVNDGLPGTTSACIARELAWADTATGGAGVPTLAYYAMAADPWTAPERKWVPHPVWPSSNAVAGRTVTVPSAFASRASGTTCTGGHAERACGYVFGWLTARADAALPGLRSPAAHRWWLDVEAERTWSGDHLLNQAIVEGMAAGFTARPEAGGVGATVGLYSDQGEWTRIMGPLREGSLLDRLDEWVAAGRVTRAEAVAVLREGTPFTWGGRVVMVQRLDGAIDRDTALP